MVAPAGVAPKRSVGVPAAGAHAVGGEEHNAPSRNGRHGGLRKPVRAGAVCRAVRGGVLRRDTDDRAHFFRPSAATASARTLRAPGRRGPGRRERSDRSRRPTRALARGAGAPTRRPVPKRQRRPGVRAAVEVRPVACRAQRAPAGHFRADTRAGTRRLGELSGRLTCWRGFSGAPLPWGPLHPTCRARRGRYPPDGRSFTTGGGSRRRDRAAESATENWRAVCRLGSWDFANHPRRPFTPFCI